MRGLGKLERETQNRVVALLRNGLGYDYLGDCVAAQAAVDSAAPTTRTRRLANLAIFTWIESWYNPHRRHSSIGQRSPNNFERDLQPQLTIADIIESNHLFQEGFTVRQSGATSTSIYGDEASSPEHRRTPTKVAAALEHATDALSEAGNLMHRLVVER